MRSEDTEATVPSTTSCGELENEDKDGDNLFCCSECNANFIFVEFVDYHHDKAKIKFIESENEE